jgi:hypothetical protein
VRKAALLPIAGFLALAPASARAAIACPEGARLVGTPPPNGNEAWCETSDQAGRWTRNGAWMAWYKSGQVRAEGEYLDGRREGRWTIWSPEGEVIAELVYEKGRIKQRAAEREPEKRIAPRPELANAIETSPTPRAIAAPPSAAGGAGRGGILSAEAPRAESVVAEAATEEVLGTDGGDADDADAESEPTAELGAAEIDEPVPADGAPESRAEGAPKMADPAPVQAVLHPKAPSLLDQLWSSVSTDSETCEYELGVPFMTWVPLPYGAKRIAPHWWVGGSTELAFGQRASGSSSVLSSGSSSSARGSSADMQFLGGAGFVRGVFTLPSGLLGIMVHAKGAMGIASFGGRSAFSSGLAGLAMLEADVLVFNEHIILAGGSLGVGYSLEKADVVLAYAFRTLGLRFTF